MNLLPVEHPVSHPMKFILQPLVVWKLTIIRVFFWDRHRARFLGKKSKAQKHIQIDAMLRSGFFFGEGPPKSDLGIDFDLDFRNSQDWRRLIIGIYIVNTGNKNLRKDRNYRIRSKSTKLVY